MAGKPVAFGGFVAFPQLSVDLPYPRDLDTCQACGGTKELGAILRVWAEFDDQDQPAHVALVLCGVCSGRLIVPHPRMYDEMPRNKPFPGAMECCRGCRHLEGLACQNPKQQRLGGEGLRVKHSVPSHTHINMGSRRKHVWLASYETPPECEAREE